MSQHPLESTVSALWQLVTEQEVRTMVVLSPIDNDEVTPFWPVAAGAHIVWDVGYNKYTVTLLQQDDYQPRTIRLKLEVGCSTLSLRSGLPSLGSKMLTLFRSKLGHILLNYMAGQKEAPDLNNSRTLMRAKDCLIDRWIDRTFIRLSMHKHHLSLIR